jgi:hypothetical protein
MPYQVRDEGVGVSGFAQLSRALQRLEGGRGNFGIAYEVQRRLRVVGETIAKAAPKFVTHSTGRHGSPDNPRLEDSVRVSVTARSASVYSTAEHGGVQNVGGGPRAGWPARGPHVRRDKASQWMNKAVASEREFVKDEMDGLLDWVVEEFHRQ